MSVPDQFEDRWQYESVLDQLNTVDLWVYFAGAMCDPVDLPGLAHFCEHMLFLGTEKVSLNYPYTNIISDIVMMKLVLFACTVSK